MIRTVLVVAGLFAAEAMACSCGRSIEVFPPSGQVPTNLVLQAMGNVGVPTLRLFDGDQAVTLEPTSHGSRWVTFRPTRSLTPQTTYRLVADDGSELATYRTLDGPDEVPPAPRALIKTTRTFSPSASTCGDSESVALELDSPEAGAEATGLLVFTGESMSSPSLQGEAQVFTTDGFLINARCSTNFPLKSTADLALAVRVIDAAGNVSELSQARQAKSAGCSTTSAELLVVLAAAVFCRRKIERTIA